jgi:hypothetical protein
MVAGWESCESRHMLTVSILHDFSCVRCGGIERMMLYELLEYEGTATGATLLPTLVSPHLLTLIVPLSSCHAISPCLALTISSCQVALPSLSHHAILPLPSSHHVSSCHTFISPPRLAHTFIPPPHCVVPHPTHRLPSLSHLPCSCN